MLTILIHCINLPGTTHGDSINLLLDPVVTSILDVLEKLRKYVSHLTKTCVKLA